jgi:hypothetical protein
VLKKSALTNLWTWITTQIGAITSITAGGAWSFPSTTRPTSGGTGTPAANSLITEADGDGLYGRMYFARSTNTTTVNNSTAFVDIGCEITLPAGTYAIDASLISIHDSTAGMKGQLLLSTTCEAYGSILRGRNNNTVTRIRPDPSTTSLLSLDTGATTFAIAPSVVIVCAATTLVKWQYAQQVLAVADCTAQNGAYIVAKKIN